MGVVTTCLIIVAYQGYICTTKFMDNPVTTEESLKSVDQFPNLKLSFCTQLTIEECTSSSLEYFDIFSSYSYSEFLENQDCTFPDGVVSNYALNKAEFWADLDIRKVSYHIEDLVQEMKVWNKSRNAWDVIVGIGREFTYESKFRQI